MELYDLTIRFFCAASGAILGAVFAWWPRRHRPTMHQLKFSTDLSNAKSEAYKTLCRDMMNGIDIVTVQALAVDAASPSPQSQQIVKLLDNMRGMIQERSSGKHMTPFEEFSIGRIGVE